MSYPLKLLVFHTNIFIALLVHQFASTCILHSTSYSLLFMLLSMFFYTNIKYQHLKTLTRKTETSTSSAHYMHVRDFIPLDLRRV